MVCTYSISTGNVQVLGYFQIIRWPGKPRTSVIDDLIELLEQVMVRAAWLLYELCVWYLLFVVSVPEAAGPYQILSSRS